MCIRDSQIRLDGDAVLKAEGKDVDGQSSPIPLLAEQVQQDVYKRQGHALVAKFALSHPLHLLAVTNFRLIHKHLI